MPLWEIKERFTFSEQILLGWRSQEQAYHMRKRMKQPSKYVGQTKTEDGTITPSGIPEKYYNEDGEVDHRKMTLQESIAYMDAIGIHMPRPAGKKPGVVKTIENQPTMDDLFGKD